MFEIGIKVKVKSGNEIHQFNNYKCIPYPLPDVSYDEKSSYGIGIIRAIHRDCNFNLLYDVAFDNYEMNSFYAAELIEVSDIPISIF